MKYTVQPTAFNTDKKYSHSKTKMVKRKFSPIYKIFEGEKKQQLHNIYME